MELSILEKLLDVIIQTSNNNITVVDEKGYIIQSNPNHWSAYGIKPEDYKGKSVYQLENEDILIPSITAMVFRKKRPVQILQQTKTGKVIMTKGYPVFDDDGEIVRVISYAQDQTEISELQEQYLLLERKLKNYQSEVEELRRKEGILYKSKEMEHIYHTIRRVANSSATVLLLGESGVGKSILAHELHKQSDRRGEPFIEVDCSTIPENLFESEMFGYESGSFTGAERKGKQGLIEQAHNGTLFLDEIGELPLAIQVKLLKVLQEKKFIRIGGKKEQHIDFRLVTATNQNLEQMVEEGRFRLDLYYRLNVIPLYIPPLRERRDDIALLLNHNLEQMNKKYNTEKRLHSIAYKSLIHYNWPGNVRELENLVERLILTTNGIFILHDDLPPVIRNQSTSHGKEEYATDKIVLHEKVLDDSMDLNLKAALERTEKRILLKAYETCSSTYEMAKVLGISQPSVVRKLKKYKS